MQPYDQPEPLAGRMAPPSDTETMCPRPQPATWPKAIGVIAIVLGALAALGGAMGAVGQIFADEIATLAPQEQRAGVLAMKEWQRWLIAEQLARFGLGVLLIVAGALLTGRRPRAVRWVRRWAVLKIAVCLGALVVGLQTVPGQVAAMQQQSEFKKSPISPEMLETIIKAGMALMLLWGIALPIFMLIWFARSRIQAEVRSWGQVDTLS